jgi:hypothetical protein
MAGPIKYFICIYVLFFSDTQQADYNVITSMTYRANGAVATSCLSQYTDLMAQYYGQINTILSQRCSAVNVNMNVSFINAKPMLMEDNVVKVKMMVIFPVIVLCSKKT